MNPDDFALSKADLDATFASEIVPWRFGGLAPSEEPVLILIGAQPGAGKTRAGRDAIAVSGQLVTSIIGDDLRAFHPAYSHLLKQAPADMPAATAQASGAWVERSIEFAAGNRISAMVEGTFRNLDTTLSTARLFKERGFQIQAVVVAVSPEVSRASIAGRYVADARRYETARFTPLKAHDDAYRALPLTIAALSAADSPVDRLIVRNRDDVLFDQQRRKGRSIRGAYKSARGEWDRTLTDDEYELFAAAGTDAAEYFAAHLANDREASLLSKQMALDQKFVSSKRSGEHPVRGHIRGDSSIRSYTRNQAAR